VEVQLRVAGPDDASDVADLVIASRHASVPHYPPLVHPDHDVQRWVREELVPHEEVWLAESAGGELLAVMALTSTWLEHLHVRPDLTGRGVGSLLVEHAKRLQPQGLQLWVFESNVRAVAFYQRHGFVTVERTDGSGNMEGQPDLRMLWRPTPSDP